jgi:hypothetical protein
VDLFAARDLGVIILLGLLYAAVLVVLKATQRRTGR